MKNKSIIKIASTILLSAACISVLAESIIFNPRATTTYNEVSNTMQSVGSTGFPCNFFEETIAGNPDTHKLFKNAKPSGKPTNMQACIVDDNKCTRIPVNPSYPARYETMTIGVPVFNDLNLEFENISINGKFVCQGRIKYKVLSQINSIPS